VVGCGRLWTLLGDLRIRRLGVRVPPGVLLRPPYCGGVTAPSSQQLRTWATSSGLYLGRRDTVIAVPARCGTRRQEPRPSACIGRTSRCTVYRRPGRTSRGCRSRCRQVDPAGGGVPRSADGRRHDLRGPLRLGGVRHSTLRPIRLDSLPHSVLSSCACAGRDPPVRRDTASDQQSAVEPPSITRRRRDPY